MWSGGDGRWRRGAASCVWQPPLALGLAPQSRRELGRRREAGSLPVSLFYSHRRTRLEDGRATRCTWLTQTGSIDRRECGVVGSSLGSAVRSGGQSTRRMAWRVVLCTISNHWFLHASMHVTGAIDAATIGYCYRSVRFICLIASSFSTSRSAAS